MEALERRRRIEGIPRAGARERRPRLDQPACWQISTVV
jgi:hypothetical protein